MIKDEIQLDFDRHTRVGFDEAILCAQKSPVQISAILDQTLEKDVSCLLTRLEFDVHAELDQHHHRLDYDAVSRTGYFNYVKQRRPAKDKVAVVAAGTSDAPVAREALRTLGYYGIDAVPYIDVGVAGLWRLMAHVDQLRTYPVIIAVAGMDGALPSVLGGLVPGVLIAVPTSTGYGASQGGLTALHAALASCAPGLCVVNIDNGYGAACAALRMLNTLSRSNNG